MENIIYLILAILVTFVIFKLIWLTTIEKRLNKLEEKINTKVRYQLYLDLTNDFYGFINLLGYQIISERRIEKIKKPKGGKN